jgi:single-stranded DNA-binding protein
VTRTYETKEGEKRWKTEIVAHEFIFIGKKGA